MKDKQDQATKAHDSIYPGQGSLCCCEEGPENNESQHLLALPLVQYLTASWAGFVFTTHAAYITTSSPTSPPLPPHPLTSTGPGKRLVFNKHLPAK